MLAEQSLSSARDNHDALPPSLRRPTADNIQTSSPGTPTAPDGSDISPTSPSNTSGKRTNPLADLIATEKTYVELLTAIIRVSSLPATCRPHY